jgi:hypothetical protein
LFLAAESDPPDPSDVEAGFEMQLSHGQYEQYDSQFQDSAPPAITGTQQLINTATLIIQQCYASFTKGGKEHLIWRALSSTIQCHVIYPLKVE